MPGDYESLDSPYTNCVAMCVKIELQIEEKIVNSNGGLRVPV
jgi:hypothetical protein